MKIPSISGSSVFDFIIFFIVLFLFADVGLLPDDLRSKRLENVEATVIQSEKSGRHTRIDFFLLRIEGEVLSFRIGAGLGGPNNDLVEEIGSNNPVKVFYYDACPFYRRGPKCQTILSITSIDTGKVYLKMDDAVTYFDSRSYFSNNSLAILWFFLPIIVLFYARWKKD